MYHEFLMPYVKLMSIVNKHLILSCGKSFSFGVFISGFGFLVKNFSVCVSIKSLILGNSERSLKSGRFLHLGLVRQINPYKTRSLIYYNCTVVLREMFLSITLSI
jgi:hypothetical protein